jgi:hypothetical protein
MSDVTGVYAFAKAYDQGYAAKLQRVSDGKAGYVERKTAEDTEKFIGNNLGDLTPFIDETGTLMYKKSDGSSMSYRQIVKNSSVKQDNKNSVLNITKYAQSMKAHEVLQPDGSYKSSPSLNEDAKRAIDSYAAQFLINPNDVADILFDAGKRKGFEIKDGNAVITEKDREDAKQVLTDAAYATFGMEVTPAPREPKGSGVDRPDKPTEADEKAIRYGQALKNLTTNANKSVLSQNIGMPKGTYDGTNKVLTTYDKDGKKYVTRFNSGVEAMDFLITQSGYDPAYVKRGLGNANSLGGFSWDFSAKQETPKPKVVDLVKESDDLENWAYKLNEKDSNTKGKIYYSKNKTIVVKYPDGTYGESDDLEEINEYIKKYNRLTR